MLDFITMEKSPLLEINDLSLTLTNEARPVNILRSLSFQIKGQETIGLVGPSGSGKTSLLLLIAGLERPSDGQIIWQGRILNHLSEQELANFRLRHLGIIFQNFHLIATMRAWENVALPLELMGKEGAKEKARDLLAELGLENRLDHFPAQLSGGEQQRVAMARAIIAEPQLILADEPTGNLDQETGQKVMDLLFRLQREKNTTLFLITHDSSLAKKCDRLLHLQDGKLVA